MPNIVNADTPPFGRVDLTATSGPGALPALDTGADDNYLEGKEPRVATERGFDNHPQL
jgi:hypothetical protein